MVEEPHLGRLMAKIQSPIRPAQERLNYPAVASADSAAAEEPVNG
jgi:hypothetical protein